MSQEEKLRKDMPKQEKNPKTYIHYTSHYTVFFTCVLCFLTPKSNSVSAKIHRDLSPNLKRATKSSR